MTRLGRGGLSPTAGGGNQEFGQKEGDRHGHRAPREQEPICAAAESPGTDTANVAPYRVLIVEQLGELGDGTCGQLSVILVVDKVHDGRLEHLGGLCQALHVGLLPLQLGGDEKRAVLHRLGVHGGPDTLGTGHGQLSLHVGCRGGQGGSVRLSARSTPSPASQSQRDEQELSAATPATSAVPAHSAQSWSFKA